MLSPACRQKAGGDSEDCDQCYVLGAYARTVLCRLRLDEIVTMNGSNGTFCHDCWLKAWTLPHPPESYRTCERASERRHFTQRSEIDAPVLASCSARSSNGLWHLSTRAQGVRILDGVRKIDHLDFVGCGDPGFGHEVNVVLVSQRLAANVVRSILSSSMLLLGSSLLRGLVMMSCARALSNSCWAASKASC